ncbi:unnamed protein product, partial [Rotaria sp. Silwood1]
SVAQTCCKVCESGSYTPAEHSIRCTRCRLGTYCVENQISPSATWAQNTVTIAGDNGKGNASNQLNYPWRVYVDDDRTILIADHYNHRIVQWKHNETTGQVVAGGKGEGNGSDQLKYPSDVIIDKETDNLIICDQGNRRVMRWPRRHEEKSGETIIENIACVGLTMDDQRFLYVSD